MNRLGPTSSVSEINSGAKGLAPDVKMSLSLVSPGQIELSYLGTIALAASLRRVSFSYSEEGLGVMATE